MANIKDLIKQWQQALKLEAQYLQSQGGSKVMITEGKYLTHDDKGTTYWFKLSTDLLLPDSTPIRLEYKDEIYNGRVVSVDGYDLVIKINDFLGAKVPKANLYSAPWELLVTLSKRLDSIQSSLKKQKRIHRLLVPNISPKHRKDKIYNDLSELILRAQSNPTTYVWGPPGTGKTYTLARTAAYFYRKGLKVLILAHSNMAVDVLMLELAQILKEKGLWKTGKVLRYGFSHHPNIEGENDLVSEKLVEKSFPNLREQLNELEKKRFLTKRNFSYRAGKNLARIEQQLKKIRSTIKKEEERFVTDASVLGVTLSKATIDPLIYEQTYDLVIVDEASMAYLPQIAFAASLGKHVIICGDFKQLPPIAMSNHRLVEKWLKRDIFEVVKIVQVVSEGKKHPNLFMLRTQRRMHPDISSFTNQFIYQNQVQDHSSVQKKLESIVARLPFPTEAAVQIDLSKMGAFSLKESGTDSRFNLFSACVAMQIILTAKEDGINSIGYITPYNAQTRLVNAMIEEFIPNNERTDAENKIVAATVHKFQGSERDMIIFDTVDSYPQSRAGMLLTDKNSEKLINVAVTRARGKFIYIVDKKYMTSRTSKNKTVQQLIYHMEKSGHSYTRHHFHKLTSCKTHPNLQWFDEKNLGQVLQDMEQARKIKVSVSHPAKLDPRLWQVLKRIEKNTDIQIITLHKNEIQLQNYGLIKKDVVMPFIQIDDDILWVGTPEIDSNFESSPKPPFFKCRLISKQAVAILSSYLNLKQPTKIDKQRQLIHFRSSYTFTQYVLSWDQCPSCGSVRKVGTNSVGTVTLNCDHCGMKAGLQDWYVQKYFNYADVKCYTCKSILEAKGKGKDIQILCPHCETEIKVETFL